MVELTRANIDSMSSREHGRGSGRNRAPDSAVLATISSADAMVAGDGSGQRGSADVVLALLQEMASCTLYEVPTESTASRAGWFAVKLPRRPKMLAAQALLQLRCSAGSEKGPHLAK